MAVTINLTYQNNNMPNNAWQAAINQARTAWEQTLADTLTLNVVVCPTNMTGSNLNGMCIPGIVQCGGYTFTRAQAKRMGLLDANDVGTDMVVALDTITNWDTNIGANVNVQVGAYNLATTVLHEICHGLGFLGLCNVDTQNGNVGIYSDTNLIGIATQFAGNFQPNVTIPNHFFVNLQSGFAHITPFAKLFTYTNNGLNKGTAADDYTAFTVQNDIQLTARGVTYTVETGAPFAPFTSCDHITSNNCLMYFTTRGQYHQLPDVATKNVLSRLGWTIRDYQITAELADNGFRTAAFADAGFRNAAFGNNGFVTAAIANNNVRTAAFADGNFRTAAFNDDNFAKAAAQATKVKNEIKNAFNTAKQNHQNNVQVFNPDQWIQNL